MVSGKTFVIDIDGILTLEKEGHAYYRRTPNKDNIKVLQSLQIMENKIILHTARTLLDWDTTVAWLQRWNVPYDLIVFGKPKGDYYLDDMKSFVCMTDMLREVDS